MPVHHQPEWRETMDYFAGLDVSLEMTSICIVDADGTVLKEAKVASEPDDLVALT